MKYLKNVMILFVVLVLYGCNVNNIMDEGNFKITIGNEFKKSTGIVYDYVYEAPSAAIYVREETMDDMKLRGLNEDSTVEDYAELIKKANNYYYLPTKRNNYVYFSYTKDGYFYIDVAYKGKDSFWLINFISTESTKNTYKDLFLKWADTIEA